MTRPADLVEEVLRIYGFNEVGLDMGFSSGYLAEFNEFEPYRVQEDLSKFLAGKGFSEILTNSLTSPDCNRKFPIGGCPIKMLNPSSEELAILKTSPIYTALEPIAYNINRKNPHLKFFEIGKSYKKEDNQYKESEWLSLYLTGDNLNENWLDDPRKATFYDLSSTVQSMLGYAGVRSVSLQPSEKNKIYEYGAVIKQKDEMLGLIGKLRKGLVQLVDIKQEVFHCQLDWKQIMKFYKSDIHYAPMPKYPEVKRDLSLVIDQSVTYSEIRQIAFEQEKKLLSRLNLFNVYEGEKIEDGKKSYAISFYLQDKFKTLTDQQIEKSMSGLMSIYERKLGAIIRK